MTSEHDTLASAYLDGDLTAVERRRVEADPAVMAVVDEFRALRARLGDVEPAPAAARESAIATAMAAYSGQFSDQPDTRPGDVVVPIRRRIEPTTWLGVAAVALIVAALGVVAVRGIGRGGDDDSIAGDAAAELPITAADLSPTAADQDAADTESLDQSVLDSDATEDSMATMLAEEPAAVAPDAADADEASDAPAEERSDGGASAEEPADDSFSTTTALPDRIESPLQLRSVAHYLLQLRDSRELGATPEHRCDFFNVLDDATFVVDGVERHVLIDVDEVAGVVAAVDEATCNVVAETTLDP